jgi:hypothetical protein
MPCRLCHGAPGFTENEFAKGLYPRPPNLASGSVQQETGDAQLFWIIKNGLKMTGMPAFGPTHTNEELWDIAGLVKIIPGIKPEEYRHSLTELGVALEEEAHHGHGEEDHPQEKGQVHEGGRGHGAYQEESHAHEKRSKQ